MTTVLTRRTLNRTTLDRQLLLRRSPMKALQAIERLVAVQGQEINAPYLGLWTRLASFTHDDLSDLLYGRHVVRGSLLRGTQHLSAAQDYAWLRPLVQPVMNRGRQAAFGKMMKDVDLAELAALVRTHLAGRTLTRPQVRDLLAERWPLIEPMALAWSAQALVPVVHAPPNGIWGRGGATPFTLAEEWLGRPLECGTPEQMVERYLAAFGPASAADIQIWSGLSRLREVVERMELRRYRGEDGRDLVDLPDAELVEQDVPAPVRFLPWFDNLVLSYADRGRVMSDEHRRRVCFGSLTYPTILVDGFVAAMWTLERNVLTITPFRPLPGEVLEEAARLLAFAGQPDADVVLAR